ncbi:MAG TPA: OmpA family protein [Candidatus Babeliales bacterium]|nr:OmpA family protein [Candidatus Babeliales bacterium]
MNNRFYVYMLLLLGLAGCGKQKREISRGTDPQSAGSAKISKYDDQIGAFVLEDDADFDIFGDDATAETKQLQAEADQFAWQELEDFDQEDGHVVQFEYDSEEIQPSERHKVKKNAKEAKQAISAGATVLVEGHSCLISHTEVYNTALSQRRGENVAREYQKAGIPRKKMKVVGRGASKAICFDDDKQAQSVNRRAETKFVYSDMDQPAR